MRFTVEPWAPEYGTPAEAVPSDPGSPPDVDVEVPSGEWAPLAPSVEPAATVLFVDGVRRVDANIWIERSDGSLGLGACAVYAAGAVRCDGAAEVVAATVERGLFTSVPGAEDVHTAHGCYGVRPTGGSTPEELWLGIQQRMGELEGRVAVVAADSGADLVVVDGPLSHHRHVRGAVGYVKTQHVQYLPDGLRPILAALPVGRRTPLFLTTTGWSRLSWYVRLASSRTSPAGIVRCEVAAEGPIVETSRLADRVTATLPRFSSHEHKDPRAPQNLYPIGGLERALRRRLGDPALMYRALRASAVRTPASRLPT